jgi:TP901-1 family phage major tail protein
MATITKGLDILVYVGEQAVGGQKNCSLSMEADTIDTSNKNDFGWASFIGGAKSWTVSCDGQFMADDNGQKALMAAFIAGTNVQVEMKNADDSVYFAGTAAITSVEVEAAYDDVCALSLELQGVGPLAMEKVENEDPDGE